MKIELEQVIYDLNSLIVRCRDMFKPTDQVFGRRYGRVAAEEQEIGREQILDELELLVRAYRMLETKDPTEG